MLMVAVVATIAMPVEQNMELVEENGETPITDDSFIYYDYYMWSFYLLTKNGFFEIDMIFSS